MKVDSPVGRYDYHVRGVTIDGASVRISGSLGVWETTFTIEPADWLALARRVAPGLGLLAVAGVCARRMAGRRREGC